MNIQIAGIPEVRRTLARLGDRAPIVLSRAINKTLKNSKTKVIKAVREEVALKRKKVAQQIFVNRSRPQSPSAALILIGKKIGIEHYGARQGKKRVTFRIRKRGAREKASAAFRARAGFNRLPAGTFWRRARGDGTVSRRLPIVRMMGPSVPAVVGENTTLYNEISDFAAARLIINADAELNFELLRIRRRS